ncbi:MAG: hypothetical protein HY057_13680 [Rhodospirillales bacterium]|nr:hypothetical protein [Rhodospirillales bacterium]
MSGPIMGRVKTPAKPIQSGRYWRRTMAILQMHRLGGYRNNPHAPYGEHARDGGE